MENNTESTEITFSILMANYNNSLVLFTEQINLKSLESLGDY